MGKVKVNERGLRVGESHPNAKLDDEQIELLLADKGKLSLSEAAAKWNLSKSGVKGIWDGRRRGQQGITRKKESKRIQRVRVRASLPLHLRNKFHRLGGSRWLEQQIENAETRTTVHSYVGLNLTRTGAK